ncbi:MAG: PKD domain-containing protein [bacterium]|nr:PKD domain-containing protein [bacterium]
MKKLNNILVIISILVNIISCKNKELPEPLSGTSIFTFNGIVSNSEISLVAGDNDYYMYSGLITNQINGVNSYYGDLRKFNCNSCGNSIKVTFNDYKSSLGGATNKDTTFYVGYYNFASLAGAPSSFIVYDTAFVSGPAPSYKWNFGDGATSTSQYVAHVYKHPGKYTTCLDVEFGGACSSKICNSINLGNTGPICEANFNVSAPTGNSFTFFSSPTSGTAPYTYSWNFGDGLTSTLQNPTHNYASAGVYQVALTVKDAIGSTNTRYQNIRTQGSTVCLARFIYAISPIANPDNLGNVIVEWTDGNGIIYSTENGIQIKENNFQVISVENYKANENKQATKKIHAKFSCTLYNGSASVQIKNADIVLAIAYE